MGVGYLVSAESDRPANITAIELGPRGTNQLRAAMQILGRLSSYVADFVNNQGLCFAPLEEGVTVEQALAFETGLESPTTAIRAWLTNYIAKNWSTDCQIIFEDGWFKKSDKERHPPSQPYFFVDGTPCYAPQTGALPSRLHAGEKSTHSYCYAIFIVAPQVALPPKGKDMTPQ
jgi:hypothetical protein